MNIEFPGKTVIVTGGAHGFGRAIAHAFAARGASTWTCDILAEGLNETAARASPAAGGRIETALVDVTDRAAVGRLVDRIAQATGRIDILVNNRVSPRSADVDRPRAAPVPAARRGGTASPRRRSGR